MTSISKTTEGRQLPETQLAALQACVSACGSRISTEGLKAILVYADQQSKKPVGQPFFHSSKKTNLERSLIQIGDRCGILFGKTGRRRNHAHCDPIVGEGTNAIVKPFIFVDTCIQSVCRISEINFTNAKKMYQIVTELDIPYIHPIEGYLKHGDKEYLISPFANCGSLDKFPITSLTRPQKLTIALDLLRGVSAMHAKKHVHGDLHPCNVLIHADKTGYRATLTDLEYAHQIENSMSATKDTYCLLRILLKTLYHGEMNSPELSYLRSVDESSSFPSLSTMLATFEKMPKPDDEKAKR